MSAEICAVVSNSGPLGEPLGCGYLPGHAGNHSWSTLPTFPNRSVPAAQVKDERELVIEDLRAILRALGLSDGARPYSAHEVVQRDILPAIRRLRSGEIPIEVDRQYWVEPDEHENVWTDR